MNSAFLKNVFFTVAVLASLNFINPNSASADNSRPRGGDELNNGAGLGERIVLYAFNKIPLFIDLCLRSESCHVNDKETTILKSIRSSSAKELEQEAPVRFDSEKKNTGFFMIDGELKVAKTGDHVGSPIYVNTDLLYAVEIKNRLEPISINEAIAIMIHELGHHHGNFTHAELDYLGVKVGAISQNHIQTTPLMPYTKRVAAVVLNELKEKSFPVVLLYVHDEIVEVSQAFRKAIKCPGIHIPTPIGGLPDLGVSLGKPKGATYHNLYWEEADLKDDKQSYKIKGNISVNCKERGDIFSSDKHYRVRISFDVLRDNLGQWRVDRDKLEIIQKYEPWWKFVVFPF